MARRFGDVVVKTAREPVTDPSGEVLLDSRGKPRTRAIGSQIEHGANVYRLPAWPQRIRDATVTGDGTLKVSTDDGKSKLLDPRFDALTEADLLEAGSAGGHDPKAHGKIRAIVRTFGSWAQGKHSVCVSRIRSEHPEVAAGKNVNALCAWLKDQWAGDTKWRGRKADPAQRAEGLAIMRRAKGTARARFAESIPVALTEADVDELLEKMHALTGRDVTDVLREDFGVEPAADPYAQLWSLEVEQSARAIADAELDLQDALMGRTNPAVLDEALGAWLAAHGDPGHTGDDPATVAAAAQLIVTPHPGTAQTALERRVQEAQRLTPAELADDEDWDPISEGLAAPTTDRQPGDRGEAARLLHEFGLLTADREQAIALASLNQVANVTRLLKEALKRHGCGAMNPPNAERCKKCGSPLREAKLTGKARKNLPGGAFALSGRRYPIHDESHARNALARVSQHGSPEEKKRVKAAVRRRYPRMSEAWTDEQRAEAALEEAGLVHVSGYTTKSGKKVGAHVRGGSGHKAKPGDVVTGTWKGRSGSTTGRLSVRGGKAFVGGSEVHDIKAPTKRAGSTFGSLEKATGSARAKRHPGARAKGSTGPRRPLTQADMTPEGTVHGAPPSSAAQAAGDRAMPRQPGEPRRPNERPLPGRGPSGRLRNFRQMSDSKLQDVAEQLVGSKDKAALEAVLDELRRRERPGGRRPSKRAAPIRTKKRGLRGLFGRNREALLNEAVEDRLAKVRTHIRTRADGSVIAVTGHQRGKGGRTRDEIHKASQAVSKGNRTRAENRRAAEQPPDQPEQAEPSESPPEQQQAEQNAREAVEKVVAEAAMGSLGRRDRFGRRAVRRNRRVTPQSRVLGGWHGRAIKRPAKPKPYNVGAKQHKWMRSQKGWSAGNIGLGTGYHRPGGSRRVRGVQRFLRHRGYRVGAADGKFGSRTAGGVRAYQKKHGLKVDGIVGPQTLRAMRRQRRQIVAGRRA